MNNNVSHAAYFHYKYAPPTTISKHPKHLCNSHPFSTIMARRKVTLAYINNPAERRVSYKKRKNGFLKKANELSTLCGVDMFAILYDPSFSAPPTLYPPSTEKVQGLISKFKALGIAEQNKLMVSHESYMAKRVMKAHAQLSNQRRENREVEITACMNQCLTGKLKVESLAARDLVDMDSLIDRKLKEITRRIESMKKMQQLGVQPASNGGGVVLASTPAATRSYMAGGKKEGSVAAPKLAKELKGKK